MGFLDPLKTSLSAAEVPVLEHRLFRLTCLVGAGLCMFVVIPMNVVQNLSWMLNLTVFAFGLSLLGLYALALRGRHLMGTLAFLLALALNACWFTDAGSQGSIGMFFFTGVMVNAIFFRGRRRLLHLGGFVANVLVLFTVDYLYPKASIPFGTPMDRYLDLITGFLVSSLACLMMLWVLVSSHDEEQKKLSAMNEDLKRSLNEIQVLQGMLPICGWCKKVRDDEGLWTQVEEYLGERTELSFTHGMCPDCSRDFTDRHQEARARETGPRA